MKPIIRFYLGGLLESLHDRRVDRALDMDTDEKAIKILTYNLDEEDWNDLDYRAKVHAAVANNDYLYLWRYWTFIHLNRLFMF